MSEFDTGYSVVIGKPVIHADKKATGSSVSFPCEAIPDGSYLVSLEVNGTVKAYRESMEFSSGSCTVGDYTLAYSSYALTVSGTSNNDIVRVMVEPLDVKTTDAFRAAVKKDAPETPNELPAVSAADDGKVLTANSGVWGAQEPIGKKFIVTLTPTAQDYSGTMDKTVAEINAAYEAGQEIWFNFSAPGIGHIELECTQVGYDVNNEFPSFNTTLVDNENNVLILLATLTTNDGTKQTYSTTIYTLTPAT